MTDIVKRKNSGIVFLLLVCVYRVFLDYSYFNIIRIRGDFFSFGDYRSFESFLFSWVLLIGSFVWVTSIWHDERNLGLTITLLFIYLFSWMPFTTLVYANYMNAELIILIACYYYVLFFLYIIFHRLASWKFVIHESFMKRCIRIIIVCVILFSVIFLSWRYSGLQISFDADFLYDLRMRAREYHYPLAFRYLFSMSRAILPFLICHFIISKRFLLASIIFITEILGFSLDGMKSAVYILIAIPFILFLHRDRTIHGFWLKLIALLILFLLCGVIENILCNTDWINNEIVRRVFFVPIYLNHSYYSFFSWHEPDFFRSSFLRHVGFSSPYEASGGIARTIGDYLGRSGMHANNGLFSDAIAVFGFSGVLIMPIVVILLLYLFNMCSYGLDKRLVTVAALQFALDIIGSSIGTVMCTHGILLIMFFMLLMSRQDHSLEIR